MQESKTVIFANLAVVADGAIVESDDVCEVVVVETLKARPILTTI